MKSPRRSLVIAIAAGIALTLAAHGQSNTFPSSGNVGIGTTSPSQNLSVTDSLSITDVAGNQFLLMGNQNSAGVNDPAIIEAANGNLWFGHGSSWSGYGGTFTSNMMITQGGYVGLGTTSPANMLSLSTGNADGVLISRNSDSGISAGDYEQLLFSTRLSGDYLTAIRSVTTNASGVGLYLNPRLAFMVQGTDSIGSANMVEDMSLLGNGDVGIGTTNPTYPLSVNGAIEAKEVIVQTGWSDYVFDKGYHLKPLSEVEHTIDTQKHLPGMPSATEVAAHGVSLGDMQAKLLAQIEQLTLHVIEQEKEFGRQQDRMNRDEVHIRELENETQLLRKATNP